MTDNFDGGIVEIEKAQAPQQTALRAVENLRRTGFEHAEPETLIHLSNRFKPFVELQRTYHKYQEQIAAIGDDPDLDDDVRVERYVAVKDAAAQKYQELSAQLHQAIADEQASIRHYLFGVDGGGSRPLGTDEQKHVRQATFREAYYKFANAPEEKLSEIMQAAEFIGDTQTMRAIASIGEMRGLKGVVWSYLQGRGDDERGKYALLSITPSGSTLDAVLSAYEPRPVLRSELGPTPRAKREKEQRERQRSVRKAGLFRR